MTMPEEVTVEQIDFLDDILEKALSAEQRIATSRVKVRGWRREIRRELEGNKTDDCYLVHYEGDSATAELRRKQRTGWQDVCSYLIREHHIPEDSLQKAVSIYTSPSWRLTCAKKTDEPEQKDMFPDIQ